MVAGLPVLPFRTLTCMPSRHRPAKCCLHVVHMLLNRETGCGPDAALAGLEEQGARSFVKQSVFSLLQEHAHILGSSRLDHTICADVFGSSPPLEEAPSRLQAMSGAHGLLDCNGEVLTDSLWWYILSGLPSMASLSDVGVCLWSAVV